MKTETIPATPDLVLTPDHKYFWKGEYVPGNNEILKAAGIIDYSGVPEQILQDKMILGKNVHLITKVYDENPLFNDEIVKAEYPECVPYFEAYKKFKSAHDFRPIFSETSLYSKRWRFATTPDRVGHIAYKGAVYLAVVQIKCTWEMKSSVGPQTYAEKLAWEENYKQKTQKRFGLCLQKDGDFYLEEYADPNDEQDFKAALWLWHQRVSKYKTLKGEKQNDNRAA